MTNSSVKSVELSTESLNQTDEEKIEALMKLGVSRKRSLFIMKMQREKIKGDAVNVSTGEHQKERVA